MVSKYDNKDTEFVQSVSELLWQRTRMNINDDIGCAKMQPSWEQDIYPQTSVTKDDIRHFTSRSSVRNSVIDKFATEFQEKGFEVIRTENGLNVKVPEIREKRKTEFSSVRELDFANKKRMREYYNSRDEYESEEEFQHNNPDADPYL